MLEDSTLAAIRGALDASTMRHQALADNIANARTPGFRPRDVTFARHVDGLRGAAADDATAPAVVSERTDSRFNGVSYVDVHREIAQMTANSVHYQALSQLAASWMHDMQNVVRDGRR